MNHDDDTFNLEFLFILFVIAYWDVFYFISFYYSYDTYYKEFSSIYNAFLLKLENL